MKFAIILAQFNVTLDLQENLNNILEIISIADEDDIIVFPEGSLSGYSSDISFLRGIDQAILTNNLKLIKEEATKRKIHIILGSCIFEDGNWYNAGICYSYCNNDAIYKKVNLAINERESMQAGNEMQVYSLNTKNATLRYAIQLCREIRFPEQWKFLAQEGAEVFFYLTNAIEGKSKEVWKSHLVSRAAENQRFVISSNTADPAQLCPSIVIKPNGEIITEFQSNDCTYQRHIIDVNDNSNWYIDQSRVDLVSISKKRDDIS